jgi:hypothetical protein
MVPLPNDDADEADEPWTASVPSSSYEASLEEATAQPEDPRVAPVPLGNIVRYQSDRVHPESLPLETADVLKKIIEGDASEVVDRALADLLGLEGGEK